MVPDDSMRLIKFIIEEDLSPESAPQLAKVDEEEAALESHSSKSNTSAYSSNVDSGELPRQ